MQKCFIFLLFFITTTSFSQAQDLYVAAKNGLSMRDKPDAKATVLTKIPYGEKLTVTQPEERITISTEGISGVWVKTSYGGKTGYVVNSYLLPTEPPKATVKTMKEYFQQISVPIGTPLSVKTGDPDLDEGAVSTIKKILYKNGAEIHEEQFYEANNNNYFLPGFTIQQGFILVRLIPEFKNVFSDKDEFPASTKTFKKDNREYTVKVEKATDDANWIEKISVEYEDGAIYHFSMFVAGGQLMIVFGGGM
jgi:uncharacterized protein YgiM (DUF1202 family)